MAVILSQCKMRVKHMMPPHRDLHMFTQPGSDLTTTSQTKSLLHLGAKRDRHGYDNTVGCVKLINTNIDLEPDPLWSQSISSSPTIFIVLVCSHVIVLRCYCECSCDCCDACDYCDACVILWCFDFSLCYIVLVFISFVVYVCVCVWCCHACSLAVSIVLWYLLHLMWLSCFVCYVSSHTPGEKHVSVQYPHCELPPKPFILSSHTCDVHYRFKTHGAYPTSVTTKPQSMLHFAFSCILMLCILCL